MRFFGYVFVVYVFYYIVPMMAWRSFVFRFNAVKCVPKSNLMAYINCSLQKIKRNQESFFLNLRFGDVLRKPKLDVLILNMRGKQQDFVLYNGTKLDGCDFLESKSSTRIMQIIHKEFENYAKLPKICPVPAGTEIHVQNLTLDANNFPPYVPDVSFSVQARLWENKIPLFELHVNGSVVNKMRSG